MGSSELGGSPPTGARRPWGLAAPPTTPQSSSSGRYGGTPPGPGLPPPLPSQVSVPLQERIAAINRETRRIVALRRGAAAAGGEQEATYLADGLDPKDADLPCELLGLGVHTEIRSEPAEASTEAAASP